jgi:hypothetical protein
MLEKTNKKRERKKERKDSHVLKIKFEGREIINKEYIFPYHPLSTHMHILINLYD